MNGLVVSLTLCLANPAHGPVDGIEPRACYELATYASRTECRITAQRVKVHVSGARLLCQARERSYEERSREQAAAAAAQRSRESLPGSNMSAVLP